MNGTDSEWLCIADVVADVGLPVVHGYLQWAHSCGHHEAAGQIEDELKSFGLPLPVALPYNGFGRLHDPRR